MSITLRFQKGTLAMQAVLKDEAFDKLLKLVTEHATDEEPQKVGGQQTPFSGGGLGGERVADTGEFAKKWLAEHSATEILNLIKWDTNTDKILLLGAFHEARGGKEGWRSADIAARFSEAKEPAPKNWARDIARATKETVIGTVTARTYKVTRAGWNKIGDAIGKLILT
jgi:hypothetical protein